MLDFFVVTETAAVSMLWESEDPAEALVARFGFADAEGAAGWLAAELANSWGMALQRCERLVISAWNVLAWVQVGEEQYIAKWSAVPSLFERLAETARLAVWLATSGIPVAAPIPSTDGRLQVEVGEGATGSASLVPPPAGRRFSLGVIPVIAGDLLDVDNSSQVIDAGRMLASVHEALAGYPDRVGGGSPAEDEQLVHNDFRSANVLHDGTTITAVLDLAEATYGTRVADLGKAAVLLGTRYRDWGPTSEQVRRTFIEAYCEQAPLTSAQHHDLTRRIATVLSAMGWA